TKCPVGNCHKMPASEFNVRMLSFEDVVSSLSRIVDSINRINNNVEIVFTVSPIRHWKDGTVENQRSKATLLLGVGEICKTCHNVSYFPAYELIMDDLRDYRFYKEDMLHPNETAIEYTWEKFKTTYIDADCYSIMAEVEKLHKALSHKVEDTVSEEYIKYCEYVNKQRKIVEDLLSPFNI
ncbi:MAG: GSCFA domain-containing protein, partial [Bacteroidales bacterium]|nr:GSCFA domain-containing protein [Bacteroidales bacterium]